MVEHCLECLIRGTLVFTVLRYCAYFSYGISVIEILACVIAVSSSPVDEVFNLFG